MKTTGDDRRQIAAAPEYSGKSYTFDDVVALVKDIQ